MTPLLRILLTATLLTPSAIGIAQGAKKTAAAPHFNGARAFQYTKEYVEGTGPRWIGSPGHTKAEDFLRSHFAQEKAQGHFEEDTFSMNTPIGYLPMRNFIVKYPGKKDGIIVLATHYETNYWLKDINFVGANDGGATTGILLEVANQLRAHPPEGYSIWLVFFDGEESIKPAWTSSDSLYGSRHLAARWSGDNTLPKIKAYLLTDMIGDRDLNLDRDANSTDWLKALLEQAGKNTGHAAYVFRNDTEVQDDHLPFKQRGVPVLDMIDINYGPNNSYHHTAQDTLDKVNTKSLQISGDLVMEMIHLINQR